MNPMLHLRLMWRHLSPASLVGFVVANLIGLSILLLGVQFYQDARGLLEGKGALLEGDYIVLSKRVSSIDALRGRANAFSQEELETLRGQPFVEAVGAFVPSVFRVTAGVDVGMGMYTYLFFESVPDEFLDVELVDWSFTPGSEEIPIILPRSYLALYNAAFSHSQGLPQISERGIGLLPLSIEIEGTAASKTFRGRIVGFSNRLNTILAPEAFVRWANEHYSPEQEAQITRLILRTDNPSDARLLSYVQEQGYEVEGDALETGEATYLLRLVSMLVGAIGLLISLLSVYLLILSVYLLLQRNIQQLENLLLLGYGTMQVARPYLLLCLGLSLIVWALATLVVALSRSAYLPLLEELQRPTHQGLGWTMLVGCIIAFVSLGFSSIAIYRRVRQIPAFASSCRASSSPSLVDR